MSNVLSEEKKQQVIALGRLGWSLRKIQKATGIHRTTAADYLRARYQPAPARRLGEGSTGKTDQRGDPYPGSANQPLRSAPIRFPQNRPMG